MDKSLAPLIAVIALIILLTFIIINSDFSSTANSDKKSPVKVNPRVQLRPGSDNYTVDLHYHDKKEKDTHLINTGEAFGKAKSLLADGKTQEAEDTLRTLLVFNPNHTPALSLLGGILFYSNRYKEAEAVFRKQIQLNPKNSLAYNRLGSTLAKQKKYREAIDNSSIALNMNPDSGEAHVNLSGMYSVIGDKEKAIEHFQEAYRLLGYAILPLSYDEAFNNIRGKPEFQNILSKAKHDAEQKEPVEKKKTEPQKVPLFKSEE
jgi:tetratricopeptide (TPR) repeat protein